MHLLPIEKMPFKFAVVNMQLQVQSPLFFNKYPGFILRSGFGAALKELCRYDSRHIPCNQCRLVDSCPYSYIFETYNPQERKIDFNAEKFPHPFVFYLHEIDNKYFPSGSTLNITLTLFGNGIDYLLFYIYAFDVLGEMGLGPKRGKFMLTKVSDHFTGKSLYEAQSKTVLENPHAITLNDLEPNLKKIKNSKILFIIPTTIAKNNRTIDTLTSEIFIRSLLRRASLLAKLHTSNKWELDYIKVIDKFCNKVDIKESQLVVKPYDIYSSRQGRSRLIHAFKGSALIKGELTPFWPLLKLGSFMHIGNSTSQGFGKYELAVIE